MDKREALEYVKNIAAANAASREEVVTAYDEGRGTVAGPGEALGKKLGIAEVLYYIGGGIVFIGITIFIWQNWNLLGFPTRLLATLGAAIAAYIVGWMLGREERFEQVASAFYLISALVLPIGLYVVFDNAGFDMGSAGMPSLISGICLGFFLLSHFSFKKNIFTLFSILFGTWFFFAFTGFLTGGSPMFGAEFFEYRAMIAALSYMLLGYGFSRNDRAPLSGFLYAFGILGFLGAALALGGWSPNQNVFWEIIFPGLALAALFVGVHIRRTSFLTFGALFLMAYILKITQEYFTSGLGWPLALVLAGLMLIGVGYLYVYLRKKY